MRRFFNRYSRVALVIRIPSDCTSRDVESLLADIAANPGQALSVPSKIARSASFGVSPLIVLAISKWQKVNGADTRVVIAKDVLSSDESRDRFSGTLHGMAAIWFSSEFGTSDGMDCRYAALESMAKYVHAMAERRLRETIRGPHVLLCCFQPAKNEFLTSLYAYRERGSRDPLTGKERVTIRSQGEFSDLLLEIQEKTSFEIGRIFNQGQLAAISAVLFQLFKNADVHTVTDERGNGYTKSMRGLMLRRVSLKSTAEVEDYANDDRKLSAFLTRHSTGASTGAFIEISIFDTGPGLAARLLGKIKNSPVDISQVSYEDELEVTKRCFELHATSQGVGGHGDGLAIAIRSLAQLGAFMSLRTGRMFLYQDFSNARTQTRFEPKHRFPDTPRLAATGGTSYTLCIPVRQA